MLVLYHSVQSPFMSVRYIKHDVCVMAMVISELGSCPVYACMAWSSCCIWCVSVGALTAS